MSNDTTPTPIHLRWDITYDIWGLAIREVFSAIGTEDEARHIGNVLVESGDYTWA